MGKRARVHLTIPRAFGANDSLEYGQCRQPYTALSAIGQSLGMIPTGRTGLGAEEEHTDQTALLGPAIVAGLGNTKLRKTLYRTASTRRARRGAIDQRAPPFFCLAGLVRSSANVLERSNHRGGSTLRDFKRADEIGLFAAQL